ncbi:hypothetical protein D3C85_1598580 [compost metagenome]
MSVLVKPATGGLNVTAGKLIVPGHPFAPVMVKVTVKVPLVWYICAGGFCPLKVVPSPKFHWKFVPAGLVLVNTTDCGAQPVEGFAVKAGTGVGRIVICFVVEPAHPRLVFWELKLIV